MEIRDNAFLITGGASGLGAATARLIAENGGKVALADLNVDAGEALAAELGGVFVKCDVSREEDAKQAVEAAAKLGTLRGLVNCAGVAPAAKTVGKDGAHPLDLFARTISINLVGTFNMIRLAAMQMSKNEPNAYGERGVIISTASVAAYDGQIGQAAYAASKGGVVGMTLPVARDLAQYGIRVNTIAPGRAAIGFGDDSEERPIGRSETMDAAHCCSLGVSRRPLLKRSRKFCSLFAH